jgi:DNA (cytosine-5)-methyltransferase 1
MTLYSIDLFAGAGGITTGFDLAGIKSLYANELSAEYAATIKTFHSDLKVDVGDIREISPAKVMRDLGLKAGELDVLAGGPPCQGFSVNAPVRSKEDRRNHLFWDYVRFVDTFKPKVVLIENVPGMVSFEKGETIRSIMGALRQHGYRADVRVLFAPHYGIPQIRWRTIFLATRLDIDPLLLFPEPTHLAQGRANFTTRLDGQSLVLDKSYLKRSGLKPATTVGEAIADLPPIPNGGGELKNKYLTAPKNEYQKLLRRGSRFVSNHVCAGLGATNLERLPHIPQGGSWRDIPFDLLPAGMKRARRSDHTKRYGRLDPDGFSSTILTKCDPHWGTYIHPDQDRVISVREAARLQSFPDTLVFQGSLTAQYEQVGNAVPPLFAKAIGERIQSVLQSLSRKRVGVQKSAWQPAQSELILDQLAS